MRSLVTVTIFCLSVSGLLVGLFAQNAVNSQAEDFQAYRSTLERNIPIQGANGSTENIGRCGAYIPAVEEQQVVQRQTERWLERFGDPSKNNIIITIPVAFHVITHNDGVTGDVPDQQLFDQIDTLNAGFASTNFRFTLHSIDRTANTNWFNDNDEAGYKAALAVDPATTLNFYTNTAGGFLGYAYLPSTFPESDTRHGVVVLYTSLPGGTEFPFDEGDTGTHEIGHYLGLVHTFQGGCSAPGDFVDDTPFQASPTSGCPEGRDSCPSPGLDPIHNYMDYSVDACMTEFTPGQSDRMDQQVAQFKPTLVESGSQQTFNMNVTDGWNMISLPYEPDDPDYTTHYPNATGTPFYFDGAYKEASELSTCTGYWLNNSVAETVPVTGSAVTSCTLNLISGWNLIGGPSCDVPIGSIADPGNIVNGTIFGWNGAYTEATTIAQGQAYWVNASQAGTITISCTAPLSKGPANSIAKQPDFSRETVIDVSDANDNRQRLYIDVALTEDIGVHSFQLPPVPPSSLFDARFANGAMVTDGGDARITLQSQHYPLSLTLRNLETQAGVRYLLKTFAGGQEVSAKYVNDAETITISDTRVNTISLSKISGNLPEEFSLAQNYPNPFNPATAINFALPSAEMVQITIYNSLGQKIMTVLNEQRDAGFYSVTWDATDDIGQAVASGVYLYRISAGSFSDIKKMILLR